MNLSKTAALSCFELLASTAWAAEPPPKVSLIGRPVPWIDSLPEGPCHALVTQGHERSTRTFAVIGPEVKDARKRYAGNKLASTVEERINGCMKRSMNGKPLPLDVPGVSFATKPDRALAQMERLLDHGAPR